MHHQHRLRGMVVSNMTVGIQSVLRNLDAIKRQLPPKVLAQLEALEARDAYDVPEYHAIMIEHLYPKAICRLDPWPEGVTRAFGHVNPAIYHRMQGRSEFVINGNPQGLGALGPPARNHGAHPGTGRAAR